MAATLGVACQSPAEPVVQDEPVGTTTSALSGDAGTDAAPPSPSIGSFAVYATEALEMNAGSLVTGCNVGVESTTGPFLAGGASAYFNSNATIASSQTLYAYSTYFNSGASIGPLDTSHILGNPGATYGAVSPFPTMPAPPPTPAATPGRTSVTLNSNATRTLAPGAYGGVSVNAGATLTLSGGAYVFSSLTLNSNGTLAVTGASTVSVTGSSSFGSGSFAGPASGSGLTAKALVLYFNSSSAINLNSGAQVQALFLATSAKVTVNTASFTGALAAAQVLFNSGGTVTCQDGFSSLVGGGGNACTGVTCTASDACHAAGTCNPSTGVCSDPPVANGTSCSDGNACTQSDTCQSGACVGGSPVTCTASGPCTTAGTCNPSTGACSNPPVANGTSCSDGNACTQSDTCQSGACVGGSPVTCTASDACHVAGTCSPSTGTCSNPIASNGTSCSDGSACTTGDVCTNGTCGGTPITCAAADECHAAGSCDPSSGVCSNPPVANGTACNDGNACSTVDTCQSGTCVGGSPVTCAPSDGCHLAGTCSPSTGACSNPIASNGTSCSDGNACTTGDVCTNGTCGGTAVTCQASDPCHGAGTCDPSSGTCSNPALANGTACNDGNACSTGDTCENGTCTGGPPVTCVASDECHTAGTCSPGSGCSNPLAAAGTSCSVGACGGSCNAAGGCIQAAAAQNACFTSSCSADGGVVMSASSCVPTLNGTVATNIASMVGGPSIVAAQVTLVRGRVLGLPEATPLAGVTVSILGHPEYTPSITGTDGTYAIAANGGAQLTLSFVGPSGAQSYLPVQRHTPTRWQQYATVPDVYLTPLDANATDIALGSSSWQSAHGSTITDPADQNGVPGGPPVSPTAPHTARLFFPSETTASFQYGPCGVGGTCSTGACTAGQCTGPAPAAVTVRLTEYTVGATGPAAMPAELPPSTGYTYAVELGADEAIAAGATGMSFNQPVSFYLEDFLGFGPPQASTVNPPIPVGYYNRQTGNWVPSTDGAIVQLTGFTGACPGSGCVAVLGEPAADGGVQIAPSADELSFLGQTYGGTATPLYLWRFTPTHFTSWDVNWGITSTLGAFPPPDDLPSPGPGPDPDCTGDVSAGSVIECQNAILAQQISIPGSPYFLRYQSERAPGRLPALQIPLTGPSWPPPTLPLHVTFDVEIDGVAYTQSFNPSSLPANDTYEWTWDQKDAFGNTVQGLQSAIVTVSYVYPAAYVTPSHTTVSMDFGSFSGGAAIEAIPSRQGNTFTFTATSTVRLGVEDAAPLGLGGWTISGQNVYDSNSGAFFGGDGTRRLPRAPVLQTQHAINGANLVPASAPNGTLYVGINSKLEALSTSGVVTTVAGGGSVVGPFTAGTSATSARLPAIQSVAVSSAGLVYLGASSQITLVDPVAGTIQTIAGQVSGGAGTTGCQDSSLTVAGTLGNELFGLAPAPDGSLYIADLSCSVVRRLGTDGLLRTVTAAPSVCGGSYLYGNGQSAPTVCLADPESIAVATDGTVFVTDQGNFFRVSRIDPHSGGVSLYGGHQVAGTTLETPPLYDGIPATSMRYSGQLEGLTVDASGVVYVADTFANAIYGIDPTGINHLIAGGAAASMTTEADGAPAVGSLTFPGPLTANPNGSIAFYDSRAGNIRSIVPQYPSYAPGSTTIPSRDGSELYVFQPFGQQLSALDPATGATLRTLYYDTLNRLTSIVDARGGTTSLTYSGTQVAITPPFSAGGQKTTLTLDTLGGHALQITTPAGETTQLAYDNGLMTSLVDPRSGLHSYTYDPYGRLTADTDPAHATTELVTTPETAAVPATGGPVPFSSWHTTATSPSGYVTTRQDFQLSNGGVQRNIIGPSGATVLSTESSAELWTTVAPDGTTTSTQQSPDPQFGMLDPYLGATTRVTPSGLTYSSTRTRTSTGSATAPSSIADLMTINGQSKPWSSLFTAVAGGTPAHWAFSSPAGRQRLQQLDSLGRVTSIAYPGTTTLPTMSFTYDADGRVSSVILTPNGGGPARVITNTYDTFLAGYLASTRDPVGDVTTYDQRDQDGRVLDVELPDFASVPQSHVGTTYDANGNVTSVTVPPATSLPSTHTFTNTPVDLLESYTPPQVSASTTGNDPELTTLATSYTYNGDRQPLVTDVPEGTSYQAVDKTYDAYGRLGATYDPLSSVTASYEYVLNASNVTTDQVGNVTTSDGVSVTNTYDGFLKTKTAWSSSAVTGSVNWTYDSFFRPSTLQVSSAAPVTFAYDLDSLYLGTSSPVFSVTRDVTGSSLDGLPYASTLGTVSDAWTYDGFGAQSSYTVKTSDGTVLYAMYGSGGVGTPITRDSLGRITVMNEQINGATHAWLLTYDARGRLESVTLDGATSVYGYDPNGNMTTVNGGAFGTYDAQDRLVSLTPPGGGANWAYSYTNNGDLTYKSNGSQDYAFDYDLSSNLRSVQVNAASLTAHVAYTIDGVNRRIARSVVPTIGATAAAGMLYDEQGRVVAELDASGDVLSTFVYGLKPNVPDYMVRGGVSYRIVSDWRGDVRLVLDTTKTGAPAVEQAIDYDAWGNVTRLVDPSCTVGGAALCWVPFGFAGGLWEPSTGLVRFGARDYDAVAGRWTQKDPIGFAGGLSSIYVYAGDDPINRGDPSGRGWLCDWFGLGCIIYAPLPPDCGPNSICDGDWLPPLGGLPPGGAVGGGGGGGGGNGMGQCPANDNGYGCNVAGTTDLGKYVRCTYNCTAMDGTKQTINVTLQGGPSGCYDPNNFPTGFGPPILPPGR